MAAGQPDSVMVTDDNRTPFMVTDDNRTQLWLQMTTVFSIMVMDDNRTPSWLWMTTGLHHGYG